MGTALNLPELAAYLLPPGKGILAADESAATVEKRFAPIGLANTEENRRSFREMLLAAPKLNRFIRGVILFDETIRQRTSSGQRFAELLAEQDIIPGIKVDLGLEDFGPAGEKTTRGLEGLGARLAEYAELGAKFAKWRSVFTVDGASGLPSSPLLRRNASDLAAYASLCQKAGLVPVVEPEVLMEGGHAWTQTAAVQERVFEVLFEELVAAKVSLKATVLKTGMVLAGKDCPVQPEPEQVASATLEVLAKALPKDLAGVVFLSGGQSELQATANLNAICRQKDKLPWPVTFSFARALQDGAVMAWAGKPELVAAARSIFLHRAEMNSMASRGLYDPDLEKNFHPVMAASAGQN